MLIVDAVRFDQVDQATRHHGIVSSLGALDRAKMCGEQDSHHTSCIGNAPTLGSRTCKGDAGAPKTPSNTAVEGVRKVHRPHPQARARARLLCVGCARPRAEATQLVSVVAGRTRGNMLLNRPASTNPCWYVGGPGGAGSEGLQNPSDTTARASPKQDVHS